SAKGARVAGLAAVGSPAAHRAMRAMFDGLLYYRQEGRQIVAAESESDPLHLTDVRTGEALGEAPAAGYARITTNNQLRRALRGAVATLDLASEQRDVRLAAVLEMMRTMDEPSAQLLRAHRHGEPDEGVRHEVDRALALVDLESSEPSARLAAIQLLAGSLHPQVHTALTALVARGEDGAPAESDPAVLAAAEAALRDIEGSRRLFSTIETLFFGLSLGSVLVLAGIGLAITFGVMGVINMAHGELMMIGAYSVYVVQQLLPQAIGASLLIS